MIRLLSGMRCFRQSLGGYFSYSLLIVLLLGFASGLPLALTASTLSARMAMAGINIKTIGLFVFMGVPYTLKFLWSPVLDAVNVPFLGKALGHRRGWLLVIQLALLAAILLLAIAEPQQMALGGIAACALLVAFLSASQDIVFDAYRVELLPPEDQGRGAACAQLGYRLGMIASSAGALWLADKAGWQWSYCVMAGLMLTGISATLLARESEQDKVQEPASLRESVIGPLADFARRPYWLPILVFVVLYKLGDAFIGMLTNPFLLAIGFTTADIAAIVKLYGTVATLVGTFAGGALVARFGAVRIMFVAGLLHALTNLLYVAQAHVGADSLLLAVSVAVENLSGGVSSAAFVAFLSGLCNRHYTATQYALLSSLAALGRTQLSGFAGYAADFLGWERFFAFAALLALPGLAVLAALRKKLA